MNLSPCNQWEIIVDIIKIWRRTYATLEKLNTTQMLPIPAPATNTPQLPSARPSSSSAFSLNLRTTKQSNALQLFQFGESIFYASLNYLRHEVQTTEAKRKPLGHHAHEIPPLFWRPSPNARTCWRNVRLGPVFSASASFADGEGPLAVAAAVASLWLAVGLQRGPLPHRNTQVNWGEGAGFGGAVKSELG